MATIPQLIDQLESGQVSQMVAALEVISTRLPGDEGTENCIVPIAEVNVFLQASIRAFNQLSVLWHLEDTELNTDRMKMAYRIVNGFLRSVAFAPAIDSDTLTAYVRALLPFAVNADETWPDTDRMMVQALGTSSLLSNSIERNSLFIVVLRELYGQVCRLSPSVIEVEPKRNSNFGIIIFLVRQLKQLVDLLYFQMELYFSNGVPILDDRSSDFARLDLDVLMKEISPLLEEPLAGRFDESDVMIEMIEDLETLLGLLYIYADLREICLLDHFVLVKNASTTKAYLYVKSIHDEEMAKAKEEAKRAIQQEKVQSKVFVPKKKTKALDKKKTVNSKSPADDFVKVSAYSDDDEGDIIDGWIVVEDPPDELQQYEL